MQPVKRLLAAVAVLFALRAGAQPTKDFHAWAPTPPMGWNSWDCFGTGVTEAQVRANTDYMAEHLAKFGWQYIVVDIEWYEPHAQGHDYRSNAKLVMDGFGRLVPAENRFPSASAGQGFKPLADYVHAKGLKFGVHLLRGIPRQAVDANTPILRSTHRASEIADKSDVCPWNGDMYGVDMSKPGAQEYYNSMFNLLAEWGVDFVKVDDLSAPKYHAKEIEGIRRAIDQCNRPMVLSTSPGETPLASAEHVLNHANMWRISNDFWDKWELLYAQFDRLRNWAKYSGPGHYPDADMLPLGAIRAQKNDWTHFTKDEQYTLMTLWSIAKSPLIFGGDLPKNDAFTNSLLTNPEVLAVDQHSENNHEAARGDGYIIWMADEPKGKDKYLAAFNTSDKPQEITIDFQQLQLPGTWQVRDCWKQQDLGQFSAKLTQSIPSHGAVLLRISMY